MKNEIVQRLKPFSDSDINSETENHFTSKELQGYFDQKLRQQYVKTLESEYNLRKESGGRTHTKKKIRITRRLLMLAAALVLFAGVVQFFLSGNENHTNDTIMAYKDQLHTPIDANVRGNQSDHQLLIINLVDAYEKKDFDRVIAGYERLKAVPISFDMNIEQMAGVAYGSTGNYKQAIAIFNTILNVPESSYSNHSTVRYLLGLVYLLDTDKAQARKILDKIKPGDYKYTEVQEMLQNL